MRVVISVPSGCLEDSSGRSRDPKRHHEPLCASVDVWKDADQHRGAGLFPVKHSARHFPVTTAVSVPLGMEAPQGP